MAPQPGVLALTAVDLLAVARPDADAELLERARGQDRAALQALYARFAPRVARFLRDLLGDGAAAADATQETFIRAFRRLETLRDDDRLLPWLFGIARHVYLEHRKAHRRDAPEAPEVDARLERTTPETLLLGREAAGVVERAMAALGDDRRTVLLLRLDHNLAYDEIARLMGWSLAKVKVEIHRGREALRAELADYEEGAP